MAGPASDTASAASPLRVTISAKSVVAGNALTVRVHGTGGHRCVLSLRADRRGALVRYRSRVRGGRTIITIPAGSAAGPRVATVTCGHRRKAVRFTVIAAPSGVPPKTDPGAPATPGPDDQGFVAGASGNQADGINGGQLGGGDYPNSRIADIALSHLGQDLFTPGWLDHGQCKQAVNDWVAAASGNTQVMGGDYYGNYAARGGTQISRDDAVKGDIIQLDNPADTKNYYSGMHTAVVVSHTPGSNTFDVVDSNFRLDDTVREHAWDPYASGAKYSRRVTIWRMGTADSAPTTPPASTTPPPSTTPAPAATYAETPGGATNTWTNYGNAGGNQGQTIGTGQTVQIACKLQGFRVADGNTWWYRIASAPWSGQYYASADAFYNNGATSGSLHGTPFVDGNVPDC
jgi:hypothetical protein